MYNCCFFVGFIVYYIVGNNSAFNARNGSHRMPFKLPGY